VFRRLRRWTTVTKRCSFASRCGGQSDHILWPEA
jgi:hypothetical protein